MLKHNRITRGWVSSSERALHGRILDQLYTDQPACYGTRASSDLTTFQPYSHHPNRLAPAAAEPARPDARSGDGAGAEGTRKLERVRF